jgi:hypothetical protein
MQKSAGFLSLQNFPELRKMKEREQEVPADPNQSMNPGGDSMMVQPW